MPAVTVIHDQARTAEALRDGDRILVEAADLVGLTGWHLEDRGLCRGDVCVPLRDRSVVESDGRVDLGGVGRQLDWVTVVDPDEMVVAFGEPAERRWESLRSGRAPAVTLPGLDGSTVSLHDYAGKKRLLLFWASW